MLRRCRSAKREWGEAEMGADFSLKSVMVEEKEFFAFTFYCEVCNQGYTTGKIIATSAMKARDIAIQEARPYFNRCLACGSWICDRHYNEDVMKCTKCAPRDGKGV